MPALRSVRFVLSLLDCMAIIRYGSTDARCCSRMIRVWNRMMARLPTPTTIAQTLTMRSVSHLNAITTPGEAAACRPRR